MPLETLEFGPEPELVRPYVRYLAQFRTEHSGRVFEDLALALPARRLPPPPLLASPLPVAAHRSVRQRTYARSHARDRRRHARRVSRGRRGFLALGSGVLALALGSTALAVHADERPTTSAAFSAAIAGPRSAGRGHLTTALVPAPGDAAGKVRTGTITFADGLCLDGGGDAVRLRGCDGSPGQTWTAPADGTLRARGRCLEPAGAGLLLHACDGGPSQAWRPGPAGTVIHQASGRCLAAPPRTDPCDQSPTQRWTLR